jgi:hypothetical protein
MTACSRHVIYNIWLFLFVLADGQQELMVIVSVPFEQERSWVILPMLDLHDR